MVRGQTFFPWETVQQTFVDVTGKTDPSREKNCSGLPAAGER